MVGPYIIAEIGQAHDGSLGMAHSYIDAMANQGVNAIKFQTHIAEAESSEFEKFRIKFSYQDKTRYDYWQRMEFSLDDWKGLKDHCSQNEIDFISTPSCLAAVDLLEKVGVCKYKIGSGDYDNYLLLEKVLKTKKPIILSTGMSIISEIDDLVKYILRNGSDLTLMQCTTSYPTTIEQWGLNVIPQMKNRYDVKIGFSDHSGNVNACIAAAALGTDVFEFHVVFHKEQFGPDTSSSILIDDVHYLVQGIRDVTNAINNPYDKNNLSKSMKNQRDIFGKSIAINRNVKKGHIITINDLESKKPGGMGILAKDYKKVLGKSINKDLRKWSFIKENDIEK